MSDRFDVVVTNMARLRQCISADDVTALEQQLQHQHLLWQELLHQVETRNELVLAKLSRWTLFSQCCRQLVDAMNRLEARVYNNQELSIEELLEKLANEFKDEQKQLHGECESVVNTGRSLAALSSVSHATDIDRRVEHVVSKWSHLQQAIVLRTSKLTETLAAIKQLEQGMGHLRMWLISVEKQLIAPPTATGQEMLRQHAELQGDIERHASGVSAVLNLCQVLAYDTDACPGDRERQTLELTAQSLRRRWNNICRLSESRVTK
jgi:hypothetical protein